MKPSIRPGDRLDAKTENLIRALLTNLLKSSGTNACVDSSGIHIRGGAAAATVSASTMTIVTVHNNYLACTDAGGASVNVARPAVNRRDTPEGGSLAPGATVGTRVDNGVTYTLTYSGVQARNVTGGTIGAGGEDQTIGPVQYVAGDVIQVDKTALAVNDDTTGTVDCPWVSVDSRAWGAVLSANVTMQGNTFNGSSQLVQTTAAGALPAISGANVTNLAAGNIASGTVAVARGGTGVATAAANTLFAGPVSGAAAAPSFRAMVAADLGTALAAQFGSVGIGMVAGTALLSVNGSGWFTNTGDPATGEGLLLKYNPTTHIGKCLAHDYGGAAYTALYVDGLTLTLNGESGGAVAVGMTPGTAKFSVGGSSWVTGTGDPSTGEGLLLKHNSSTHIGRLACYDYTGSAWKTLYVDGLTLTLNGESGGNVGIGMAPTYKLDINGHSRTVGVTDTRGSNVVSATVLDSGLRFKGSDGKVYRILVKVAQLAVANDEHTDSIVVVRDA